MNVDGMEVAKKLTYLAVSMLKPALRIAFVDQLKHQLRQLPEVAVDIVVEQAAGDRIVQENPVKVVVGVVEKCLHSPVGFETAVIVKDIEQEFEIGIVAVGGDIAAKAVEVAVDFQLINSMNMLYT
ncbi:hypothetical protein HK099_006399 [Clydaea vesicula]|uniref:Uncharacterized protein n=1 Tax=Clydaea vesicula TaxID=447962 RepID=A0AAD5Y320_9FUNG|nr:hypothetical protein HK099_006399 [Clydaea vesicula]